MDILFGYVPQQLPPTTTENGEKKGGGGGGGGEGGNQGVWSVGRGRREERYEGVLLWGGEGEGESWGWKNMFGKGGGGGEKGKGKGKGKGEGEEEEKEEEGGGLGGEGGKGGEWEVGGATDPPLGGVEYIEPREWRVGWGTYSEEIKKREREKARREWEGRGEVEEVKDVMVQCTFGEMNQILIYFCVYHLSYDFEGKKYLAQVHGTTRRVVGERPYGLGVGGGLFRSGAKLFGFGN